MKLFSSYALHSNRSEFREIDIVIKGLSVEVLETQVRKFEAETVMAEHIDENAWVFQLATKIHLNFALIHPDIKLLDNPFLTTDWARMFLLDRSNPNLDAFNAIGAVEFEYDQYLKQAKNLMKNCAFH